MIRSGIILLYLRIFGRSQYRIVFLLVWAYTILWAVVFIIVSLVECRPLASAWQRSIPGTCIDLAAFQLGMGVLNIIGDILVLVAPVPIVWKLRASKGKKIAILGIFALGGL